MCQILIKFWVSWKVTFSITFNLSLVDDIKSFMLYFIIYSMQIGIYSIIWEILPTYPHFVPHQFKHISSYRDNERQDSGTNVETPLKSQALFSLGES